MNIPKRASRHHFIRASRCAGVSLAYGSGLAASGSAPGNVEREMTRTKQKSRDKLRRQAVWNALGLVEFITQNLTGPNTQWQLPKLRESAIGFFMEAEKQAESISLEDY